MHVGYVFFVSSCTHFIMCMFATNIVCVFLQPPVSMAKGMVKVINRLKAALINTRTTFSSRSPRSTQVVCLSLSFSFQ